MAAGHAPWDRARRCGFAPGGCRASLAGAWASNRAGAQRIVRRTPTIIPKFPENSENNRELGIFVNEIRKHVEQWRELPPRQWDVTPETHRLLWHWRDLWSERKLFFGQREAVETLIWPFSSAPGSIFFSKGHKL
jgi:hypothetical protein